jgi:redox-sensitive bicupin YhaK (pirin superfamily)
MTPRLRRARERGFADHGWLRSFHTFSFAEYHDPAHMGFRSLRVLNEDRVAPGGGFGTHPHRDMEIISYVLEGALEHRDSLGNGSIIRPGEVQRMTAGTGIRHSEFNASRTEGVHFLQLWILPARRGLAPSYEQRTFLPEERRDRLRLVASADGREGSVTVHQDVSIRAALLGRERAVTHEVRPGRGVWLHVARGAVRVGGERLVAGDAAAVDERDTLRVEGDEDESEVLILDLA